jgi:hypothetical protein
MEASLAIISPGFASSISFRPRLVPPPAQGRSMLHMQAGRSVSSRDTSARVLVRRASASDEQEQADATAGWRSLSHGVATTSTRLATVRTPARAAHEWTK